jgi:tetratricopeptide (TPR) repeat protein
MRLKKSRYLKLELVALFLVICIWIVKSAISDLDSVKAGVFKQVVKIDTNNITAYRFLAGYYNDSGRYDEAIEAYKEAVKIKPDDIWIWIHLGDAYASSGQYERAIETYKKAESMDPELAWIHICLAFTYRDLGSYPEAADAFKQAIKLEPDVSAFHVLLGDTYVKADCFEEAAESLKQIEEFEPDVTGSNVLLPFKKLSGQELTPDSIINKQLDDLLSIYREEENKLRNIPMSDKEFANEIHKLQSRYDTEKFGILEQRRRIEIIKKMVNSGAIKSEVGEEAMWRVVLPPELLQAYIATSEKSLQNEKTRALQEAERIATSRKDDITCSIEDKLAGGPGVVIDMICIAGKKSYFMVGENIYYQGDTINGFKIQKITAFEVSFEKDGKTFNRSCH